MIGVLESKLWWLILQVWYLTCVSHSLNPVQSVVMNVCWIIFLIEKSWHSGIQKPPKPPIDGPLSSLSLETLSSKAPTRFFTVSICLAVPSI